MKGVWTAFPGDTLAISCTSDLLGCPLRLRTMKKSYFRILDPEAKIGIISFQKKERREMSVTVHFEVKESFHEALSGETVAACLEKIFKQYPEAHIRVVGAEGEGVAVDPRPEALSETVQPKIDNTAGLVAGIAAKGYPGPSEDPGPTGHA